jgi:exopolyphosphatase/guanosine-5'-triphosphate,3'-diphosphate pyrophosphatase
VQHVALGLLAQMLPPHSADAEREAACNLLGWAAELHEIGTAVAHIDHHKHGAYLLDHADAAGMSMTEMHRLSLLVLGQRGKVHKLVDADFDDALLVRQLVALRLAVILCHARRDPDTKGLQLACEDGPRRRCVLRSPPGWSARFPQSAHLLGEEEVAWQKTPWAFSYKPGG